jgi:hypothetical protein
MRQSAKLNVFLGVRNLNADFLPEHLKYLQTYFVRAPMNALLPVSVAAATLVAIPLWQAALAPGAGAYEVASLTLVASLLSLAILEHALLVLPLGTRIGAVGIAVGLGLRAFVVGAVSHWVVACLGVIRIRQRHARSPERQAGAHGGHSRERRCAGGRVQLEDTWQCGLVLGR